MVRINKMVNNLDFWLPPLSFKISLKDTSFRISVNFLGLYLSPECLLNVLSNFYIPQCIDSRHFYSCPSPLKTCPQVFVITPHAEENYSTHRQHSFKNLLSPTKGKGIGNYDLLYQNPVRKNEDDLEH